MNISNTLEYHIEQSINLARLVQKNFNYNYDGMASVSCKLDENAMIMLPNTYNDNNKFDNIVLDYQRIINHLLRPISEYNSDYYNFLNSCVLGKNKLNNYDAGIHSLCNRYVLHSHSIYVAMLVCTKEGQKIAQQLFPNSIWVPYKMNGIMLDHTIKYSLLDNNVNIIYLQNHGIIVQSNNAQDVYELHNKINLKIRDHFELFRTFTPQQEIWDIDWFNKNIILEHQIYAIDEYTENNKSKTVSNILCACNFILKHILTANLTPNILSKESVDLYKNHMSIKCAL